MRIGKIKQHDLRYRHLLIAGLMHDIGKVMQRADVALDDQSRQLGQVAGPTRDLRPSHVHVQWTSQFFDAVLPPAFLPADAGIAFDDRAAQLAFRHHNPATPLQWLLAEADRLASGMDRGESRQDRVQARMVPLLSVLSRLQLPSGPAPSLAWFAPAELDPSHDTVFPASENEQRDFTADYARLWAGFCDALKEAPAGNDSLEILDDLMLRFFSWVPAATTDVVADTSLYDHSRTVTALAAVKYQYHRHAGDMDNEAAIKDRTVAVYRLVVGDLSGIQRYIFDIAHAGAGGVAKALRARSLTVGLIVDVVARKLLDRCHLPSQCLLLSAGGKFYAIVPNWQCETLLAQLEQEVAVECRRRFNGEVGINLASIALNGEDLQQQRLREKMAAITQRLSVAKLRPLRSVLVRDGSWDPSAFVLHEVEFGPDESLCTSCRKFPGRARDEYEGRVLCDHCDDDRWLGRRLTQARYLQVGNNGEPCHPFLDWSVTVGKEPAEQTEGVTWRLDPGPGHGRWRLLARHIPLFEDEGLCPDCAEHGVCCAAPEQDPRGPLFFGCIARCSKGRPMLGFLKADVDSLGLLIGCGLPETQEGWTLSRFATFSRLMETFFSGRLEWLLRTHFPRVYTVYAGGDDLFLVGPWDVLIALAGRLREEFSRFSGGNPNLTLSCGIALTRPATPVFRAVEHAEALLTRAKAAGKNRCAVLDHVLPWESAASALEKGRQLAAWLLSGDANSAFARNLLYYGRLFRQYKEEGLVVGLRFAPLLSYDIARNLPKPDDEREERRALRTWADSLRDLDNPDLGILGWIAAYALNSTRGVR